MGKFENGTIGASKSFVYDEQLFAETAEGVNDTAQVADATQVPAQGAETATPVQTPAPTQTDTQKAIAAVEAALESLKTGTGDLITAEITGLETTLKNLKVKAEAEATVLETEVKAIEVAEKTFIEKYGTALAHGAEIILLIYISGRLANLF
jgi:hypothetical protein